MKKSLERLARPSHGARGPLALTTTESAKPNTDTGTGLVQADHLEQHLRRSRVTARPRDSLWRTCSTVKDPAVLHGLIVEAEGRGRFQLAQHLREAAAGSARALLDLARLRELAGDHDGGRQLAREATAAGDTDALGELHRPLGGGGVPVLRVRVSSCPAAPGSGQGWPVRRARA